MKIAQPPPQESSMNDPAPRASFTTIEQSTAQDWRVIREQYVVFNQALPDRILAHLRLLDGDYGGFPIDRLQHCLQTATRAHRGGEEEEYVVCALLHDVGDTLGSFNHADVAAVILKPFVSPENHWMVDKHGVFQGYYFFHYLGMDRQMREQFRGHPAFERTADFCERYDGPAFDPQGETLPLDFFAPMVRRVFAAPRQTMYTGFAGDSLP